MTVSDRLKKRRLELGLSAAQVGERVGKNKTTIYRYENGVKCQVSSVPLDDQTAYTINIAPETNGYWK